MDKEKLKEILFKHEKWLNDINSGERANLRNANLSNAVLRNANLSNAVLRYANLSNADLSNANFSYADLSYADLSNANFSYAVLSNAVLSNAVLSNAKNFILLPVADYRGYSFAHAVKKDDGNWLINSGCRSLLIEDAKKHWGDGYQGDRDIGDQYLYAIDWLEKKLEKMEEERL